MIYTAADHTFVICAYKECAFLEDCIESLLNQSVKTRVIMATSTPNDHICSLAKKYGLPLHVNNAPSGIATDWNFAISCADTELITVAHQDDLYLPDYTGRMLQALNAAKSPLFFSSNYAELRPEGPVKTNKLLAIKRILCVPIFLFPGSKAMRRLSLSFGCPLMCPTVTYIRDVIMAHPYESKMRASLDWEQYEKLSHLDGSFVYTYDVLLYRRIHPESETSNVINSTGRASEDYEMFQKFWPDPIAKILVKLYSRSEKSNRT